MNAALPASPPETTARPLADAVRIVEPRLLELVRADDLDAQLRRFVRRLRPSAEQDALARKDVNT